MNISLASNRLSSVMATLKQNSRLVALNVWIGVGVVPANKSIASKSSPPMSNKNVQVTVSKLEATTAGSIHRPILQF